MGDMADIFRANDEFIKNRRAKRAEEFEPLLIKAGAIQKSGSVYMLDDYLCYPTKGYCAYKKDYRKTKSLREFLKERGLICGGETKPPEQNMAIS